MRRDATLAEVGEFALIAAITEGLGLASDVRVGPGDDAAVLAIEGAVATSVDVLVEGVHFRRDWSEARDVGRKAVAVNVADLEAIGARATGLLVGFSAPADLKVGWVLDFADGLGQEGEAARVSLLGGDVTRARDITIAVTAMGSLEGREPVLRSGAQPGNVVAIHGRLGWAAAGLAVLGRGFRSPRVLVEAQRVPQVSYGAGAVAARAGATSMIDISDGLLADLGHVAQASGVRIDLRQDVFEVAEPLQAVGAATGADPYTFIFTGGDDHALAATFLDAKSVPEGWLVVGRVEQADHDQIGVLVDGAVWETAAGFDHFRSIRATESRR
ncbi:MAG TPA: thiamine-phosphate kinase [Propionibacteriaceae bacterium]|nr:thiamine-phosphate kinase [Propionibacteriaceae bacterium]